MSSYQKNGDVTNGSNGNGSNGSPSSSGSGGLLGGWKKWALGAVLVALLAVIYGVTSGGESPADTKKAVEKEMTASDLSFDKNGKLKLFDSYNRFVLEDYDVKSTFTSMLPALAGYFGKPVWAFYVNRGQAMATFGTTSKDYPILEFNSANKAYQLTPYVGFRTFVRGTREGTTFETEPFSPETSRNLDSDKDQNLLPKRILYVGTNEFEIADIDTKNGLTTNVQYFILPEEDFGALVRRTKFTNTGSSTLKLDALDGLAKMEPYGGALDWGLKQMGRTLEGWMGVYHVDDKITMPYYKLSTEPTDSASVKIEVSGHYCVSFIEDDTVQADLLPIVFDTSKVFGKDTALDKPQGLYTSSVGEIVANPQYGWAKTSSAFAALDGIEIAPGESITIATVFGMANQELEVPVIASRVTVPGYIAKKFARARAITNELSQSVETTTANPLFDGTVRQMFLDNGLRGGFPTILGNVDNDLNYDEDPGVKVYHTFSRIHGDLERDYNNFKIAPTFFSQGPGNYRDIAQNRRNDVTFQPRMGSFDVKQFLSYIQADGYEPLTVEAVVFLYEDHDQAREVANKITNDEKSAEVLGNVLVGGAFRPGQLFSLCEQLGIHPSVNREDFLNAILAGATDRAMAVYGQGYWADHWDYYIDMIEAYLEIYPDNEENLMYESELGYFFSTATVKPRAQKYVLTLTYDGQSHHVQQLDSTFFDEGKVAEQENFRNANTGLLSTEASWQRTKQGVPFTSSAIAKLFLLGSIKYAMRDAWGMGVEYEGGRPGWLDSMNGLPGMVGSGMPETYELKLLLQYVQKVVTTYKRDVVVPEELGIMINKVNAALETLVAAKVAEPEDLDDIEVPQPLFDYWDTVATAREEYRASCEYYYSGNTTTFTASQVDTMITNWLEQIDLGIERSFKVATKGFGDDGSSGIPASFFAYDITKWEVNDNKSDVGLPCVNALAMKVRKFPLFLEGPVRYLKTVDKETSLDIYDRVKSSGLRDTILNMYFLSASLKGQTYDMGRQVSFAPGWLENQSIWMHMSYKYYLQMIRNGLYDQFFEEFKGGGILPFMDPDVYGRSLMECSSFIASSAFPDPSIVGEGFLPRLSGSTAEFMDMWKNMFIGKNLFSLGDDGKVVMKFSPVLPDWLFEDPDSGSDPMFDEDGNHIIKFKLFGTIPVTYHNKGGKTLYGVNPSSYKITLLDGTVKVDGPVVPTKTAIRIRKMKSVTGIDAYFD